MARRIIRSTPALRMVRLKWDHKCEQAVKTIKCYVRCRRQVLECSDWRSPAKHPNFWRGMWRWGELGSPAVIRKLVTEVGFTPTSLFKQSIIAGIFVMRKRNKSRSKLAVSDTTFLHLLGAGGNSISWVTWKTGRSSGKYTVGSVSSGGDGLDDLIQEVFSISHFYDLIWLRPREHNKKVTTHHYVRQVFHAVLSGQLFLPRYLHFSVIIRPFYQELAQNVPFVTHLHPIWHPWGGLSPTLSDQPAQTLRLSLLPLHPCQSHQNVVKFIFNWTVFQDHQVLNCKQSLFARALVAGDGPSARQPRIPFSACR